jgi:hypothetical protein
MMSITRRNEWLVGNSAVLYDHISGVTANGSWGDFREDRAEDKRNPG